MRASLKIEGLAENRVLMRGRRERSQRFIAGVAPQTVIYLRNLTDFFFERGGGPDGEWQPNSAFTVARKGHGKVLIDTTRLRQSLTHTTPDSVLTISDLLLRYGTRVEYAYRHQHGRGVPLRRFMPEGSQYVRFVRNRSIEYILGLGHFTVLSDPSQVLREELTAISRLGD